MFENLIRLSNFTNNNEYLKIVDQCIKVVWQQVLSNPFSLVGYVHAVNLIINSHHIVVFQGNDKIFNDIRQYLHQVLVFNTFACIINNADLPKNSLVYDKKMIDNKTMVYICSKSACYKPITNMKQLKTKLQQLPFL